MAGMIEPFEAAARCAHASRRAQIVSYGTSRATATTCAAPTSSRSSPTSTRTIVDPKNFDEKTFVDFKCDVCIIPPNSFALARTVEYFRIPRSVLTICLGKSTYARCGIIVNVTPLEPEWEGHVTLEFSNTTPLPAKIYADEGCAQMLFFESRRGLRDLVRRPWRQVPGPAGRDAAAHLAAFAGRLATRARGRRRPPQPAKTTWPRPPFDEAARRAAARAILPSMPRRSRRRAGGDDFSPDLK